MKFGLEEDVIVRIQQVFESNPKIDEAVLFGSRAKGNFRENSDIDLALKGRKLNFEDIVSIGAKLIELNLPFEIDLLDYEKISEPALVEHIDRVGVVFWERWKEIKLEEVCEIITGYAFKGDLYESTGTLRVVRGENVTIGNLRWDSQKFWNGSTKGLEKYFLKEEDVVIGMDGSRVGHNRAFIKNNELPLILAQRVARLRVKSGFNQKYLWYNIFLNQFKDYVESIHTGTSIPHISQSQIANYHIIVPPFKEQEAIASTLSSLDDKIDLLQRQNKTLEELAETAFSFCYEKFNSEWEDGYVGDLLKLQRGFDLPIQNRIEGEYPVISASGFNGFHREYKVKGPGVSTGRSGLLGEVFYIDEDFWPLNTSLFVTDFKRVSPLFAYFFLKTLDLASLNGGSAVPTLNRNDVHSIPAKIPPVGTVERFDKMVAPMYDKKRINQIQIASLTKIRDSLLPKLMNGEIRIN